MLKNTIHFTQPFENLREFSVSLRETFKIVREAERGIVIRRFTEGFIIFFICLFLFQCKSPQASQENLSFRVEAAPEWTKLFKRNGPWFGGDGIFFIPKSGNDHEEKVENILLFSDTMVGDIKDSVLQPGYRMMNNSMAFLKGREPLETNIEFSIAKDEVGKEKAIFIPDFPISEEGEYYWLGDGFVHPETGDTHIFAYRVSDCTPEDGCWFLVHGGALITVPKGSEFPYLDQKHRILPFFFPMIDGEFGSFGAGVYVNTVAAGAPYPDGYIYIYGVKDPNKQMLVARVKSDQFEIFEAWRFWDGDGWNPDFMASASVIDAVSNELSVTPLPNGQWLAVFQVNGMSPKVGISVGESPVGPFEPIQEIWDCSDDLKEPEFFAYNAKAHPSISNPGELLISYNVNSLDFWNQIEDYPNLYRPRFLKLIFEK